MALITYTNVEVNISTKTDEKEEILISDNKNIVVSYSCDKLIRELKRDIAEFGNFRVIAYTEIKEGLKIVTDWIQDEDDNGNQLSLEELTLNDLGPTDEESIWRTNAETLLKTLKLQNDPIRTNKKIQSILNPPEN